MATGLEPCRACAGSAATRCPRCAAPLCATHRPRPGGRCDPCEEAWARSGTRRAAAQAAAVVPAFVVGSGLSLGMLLPLLVLMPTVGGAAAVVGVAAALGAAAASGAGRLVARLQRARFLDEQVGALPPARAVRLPALPPGR